MEADNIKKEYTKNINNKLEKYRDIILESFIEFYGENYRTTITDRFNNISFLYYINDITIFYIVDSLKGGYSDKFKKIIFAIPYMMHLITNGLYNKDVTPYNFYELGINKIVGSSNDDILSDKQLLEYSITIALRKKNECPYEINIPTNQGLKRIIALPIFSVDDRSLFHEINHAICAEIVIKNGERIVKCGLDYSSDGKKYIAEIINDIVSLEIYNIFKSKCSETILEDNIMDEVLLDVYSNYHHLIIDFYKQNKEKIKASIIEDSTFQMEKTEFESFSKLIQQQRKK